VHHQFISHDTEFDYLKSIEVEPKINKIRFCRPVGQGCSTSCLLSTNDKCVKLWKVSNRSSDESVKYTSAAVASYNENKTLSLPTRARSDNHSPRAWSRRVYKNAHVYHINSIDISYDGETFLSADDLRINLWDLDRSDTSLNVIDIKPGERHLSLCEADVTTTLFRSIIPNKPHLIHSPPPPTQTTWRTCKRS